ncbi:creatininase family protein [Kutzneria sp. NPDC051319]|uniref:creatininase family protein n=1 Tax=Kutzneria sp. NPDC051319 TaxID=3155047 RepID=UPI003442C1CA
MHLLPTATAIDEVDRAADVAVLPIGSFEQHGSHLPLATDTIVAHAIGKCIADAYELLLLPPITISCSHEHSGLHAGTVSISAKTLYDVVFDIARSLEHAGIQKMALISGHGGNYVLSNITQEANTKERRILLYPSNTAWDQAHRDAGLLTSGHDDMHGGERETSILLHVAPELVNDSFHTADHDAPARPDLLTIGMAGYTASGIIGHPSLATATKGATLLGSLTDSFADRLAVLRG